MQITYVGPYEAVEFEGIACERGEAIHFPHDVAARALEQDIWSQPVKGSSDSDTEDDKDKE
jgi:hypothetical protein